MSERGTAHDGLARARSYLSEAFAELDAVTGLDVLGAHAVLELRADVGETIRRLSNVLVFIGSAAKPTGGRTSKSKAIQGS